MNAYKVSVKTTNSSNTNFKEGGKYYDCVGGVFYCIAETMLDVVRAYPTAITKIECIGEGAAILREEVEDE